MPKGDQPAYTDKQKRRQGAVESGQASKGAPRPEAHARPRAPVNLIGGGKAMASGRKVPFGPVGGLGRKTNLSRSS